MKIVILGLLALCALGCTTTKAAAPPVAACQPAEGHTGMQPMLATPDGAARSFDHAPTPGEKAICAVSGEAFEITAETKTVEHEGRHYAFCCDACAPDFAKEPSKFADQKAP